MELRPEHRSILYSYAKPQISRYVFDSQETEHDCQQGNHTNHPGRCMFAHRRFMRKNARLEPGRTVISNRMLKNWPRHSSVTYILAFICSPRSTGLTIRHCLSPQAKTIPDGSDGFRITHHQGTIRRKSTTGRPEAVLDLVICHDRINVLSPNL